ncbi:PAS domain-containing protein [Thalassobaculum salexigens]|uniref:PAS domain-containing protein n=1 Tax=Thalassobaculum salexigens TaxID=455360 RepID=UPI00248D97E5|nr:PAS domain-containing protein [Thalassobaculum salexigens]
MSSNRPDMPTDPDAASGITVPLEALVGSDAPRAMHDFVKYWIDKRGEAWMPAFGDIDPVEIPWALSRIYVVDVLPDGDFVYRLAGEAVAERYDRTLKGTRISDLFSDRSADLILERWRRVASGPSAYYSYTQHASIRGPSVTARRVMLPLGGDGRTADRLLGFAVFDEDERSQDQFSNGLITKDVRWSDLRR